MSELNNMSLKVQMDIVNTFTNKLIEWDIPINDFASALEGVSGIVNNITEEEKTNMLNLLITSLVVSQHDYN